MSKAKTSRSGPWSKTKTQGMLRHKNSAYYARFFIGGKEKWRSLRTKVLVIDEERLAKQRQAHGLAHSRKSSGNSITMKQAAKLFHNRTKQEGRVKPSTIQYHREIIKAIELTWPGLWKLDVKTVTEATLLKWGEAHRERFSASRYNGSLGVLNGVFKAAREAGAIERNPAGALKRARVPRKELRLPTKKQFHELIEHIRQGTRYT